MCNTIQYTVQYTIQYSIQIKSIQALQTKGPLVNKKLVAMSCYALQCLTMACYISESQGLWAFRAKTVSVANKAAWMILGRDDSILDKETSFWIKKDVEAGVWTLDRSCLAWSARMTSR